MMEQSIKQMQARAVELQRLGFAVIPLGNGPEGKAPAIRWRNTRPLGLEAFTKKMAETRATMYGVRLEGLIVLDVDSKDERLLAQLEETYGQAAVVVATPRGHHLYYRCDGKELSGMANGLPVDVKRGGGHYVVGPGSIRPSGVQYLEIRGRLGESPLTSLCVPAACSADASCQAGKTPWRGPSQKVRPGARHKYLMATAREYVAACETAEELHANLIALREEECLQPDTVSDDEVWRIAVWTFERWSQGRLYGETGGSYQVPRGLARQLYREPNALALFCVLRDNHGHRPRATFQLAFGAMKDGGLINMSERAFLRAVTKLREVGAIVVARNHRAGVNVRDYRLGAQNPVPLSPIARGTGDFRRSGDRPT